MSPDIPGWVSTLISLIGAFGLAAFTIQRFQHVDKMRERELDLKEREYRLKEYLIDKQIASTKEHAQIFEQISPMISSEIVTRLSKDVSWVNRLLERSSIAPFETGLFGTRWLHYQEEKRALAEFFSKYLNYYIVQNLNNNADRVLILIDSGTTIYPIFHQFEKTIEDLSHLQDECPANEKYQIITNNIAGLIRPDARPKTPFGDPTLKPIIVPGTYFSRYAAIVGEESVDFLRKYIANERKRAKKVGEKLHIFGVVTGNWILSEAVTVGSKELRVAMPLVRGALHKDFKQALVEESDDVVVISPLGKVLRKMELPDLDLFLSSTGKAPPEDQKYKKLFDEEYLSQIGEARSRKLLQKLRLFTTHRSQGFLLRGHSTRLANEFGVGENVVTIDAAKDIAEGAKSCCFLGWDPVPDPADLHSQTELEFPHQETQENAFREYFEAGDRAPRAS